jgi:predicted transcriptional regulator
VKFTIDLPDDVQRRLESTARSRGMTASALAEELLSKATFDDDGLVEIVEGVVEEHRTALDRLAET